MAAILNLSTPSFQAAERARRLEADVAAEVKRCALERDPRVWAAEALRVGGFLLVRVLIVPWALIWPAVIGWIRLCVSDGDLTAALEWPVSAGLLGLYVVAASLHSATVWSRWEYESEVSRRLTIYMTHWHAEARRNRDRCRRRSDRSPACRPL